MLLATADGKSAQQASSAPPQTTLIENPTVIPSCAKESIIEDANENHPISLTSLPVSEKCDTYEDPTGLSEPKQVDEEEWIKCAGQLAVITDQAKNLIQTLNKEYQVHNKI